jgi:hypothetical protein
MVKLYTFLTITLHPNAQRLDIPEPGFLFRMLHLGLRAVGWAQTLSSTK